MRSLNSSFPINAKFVLLFWIFFANWSADRLFAQKGAETNLWLSGQFTYQGQQHQHTVDASWRTDDYFIREQKQQLLRYTYLARLRKSTWWIGGGIAGFRSYQAKNDSWRPEIRPFFQAQYTFEHQKTALRFRYRNELRMYLNPNEQADRNRFQVQLQQKIRTSSFKVQASAEVFYTIHSPTPWEYRLGGGVLWNISSNWQLNLTYLYQQQQRLAGIDQHIVLLSIAYQIKK